jgi:YidC/Oxa1 family membrane protein insertase
MTSQQRLVLAMALSFIFFIGYDYFFVPKQKPQEAIVSQDNSTKQVAPISASQTPTSEPASSVATSVQPAPSSASVIAKIIGTHFEAHIDSLGRVSQFYLNDNKYQTEDNERIELFAQQSSPKPLEVRFGDASVNEKAFANFYTSSASELRLEGQSKTITLTQQLDTKQVIKTITFHPSGAYSLKIEAKELGEFFVTPGFRPSVVVDAYTVHGVEVMKFDGTKETIEDGDATGLERYASALFAAASDRYYTTFFYKFDSGLDVVLSKVGEGDPVIFAKANSTFETSGFLGPKEFDLLNSIDARLTEVIEYGFFTFISKPLFSFLYYLHSMVGNWGWAIVILTLIIRLVLYPLTYKGMVSMNKLKELSPKIKEIQAKYKGEPQKMNAHMMELYKKHGANPMGGCLPMLMQIPIFFAIYRVLLNAIELKSAPWALWIEDLSVMDPYFVLPILMGATMFWQQRITPTNFTDPMQEKIMKFLPLIFTFFFVTFPAGLTLYWFVNNLFSVAQQYYVNKLFENKKMKETKE